MHRFHGKGGIGKVKYYYMCTFLTCIGDLEKAKSYITFVHASHVLSCYFQLYTCQMDLMELCGYCTHSYLVEAVAPGKILASTVLGQHFFYKYNSETYIVIAPSQQLSLLPSLFLGP